MLRPGAAAARGFPASVNVGFAQVVARDRIRLRVYERGVGETLACGSGACAAVAILMRRGRVDRDVAVALPGGTCASPGRRRRAESHARAGRIRVRRRVDSMSDTHEKLGAHEVAAWLRRHPTFLSSSPTWR